MLAIWYADILSVDPGNVYAEFSLGKAHLAQALTLDVKDASKVNPNPSNHIISVFLESSICDKFRFVICYDVRLILFASIFELLFIHVSFLKSKSYKHWNAAIQAFKNCVEQNASRKEKPLRDADILAFLGTAQLGLWQEKVGPFTCPSTVCLI